MEISDSKLNIETPPQNAFKRNLGLIHANAFRKSIYIHIYTHLHNNIHKHTYTSKHTYTNTYTHTYVNIICAHANATAHIH